MDQFSKGGRPELSRVFLLLKSFKNNKLALLSQGQQHYEVSSVCFLLIYAKKGDFIENYDGFFNFDQVHFVTALGAGGQSSCEDPKFRA